MYIYLLLIYLRRLGAAQTHLADRKLTKVPIFNLFSLNNYYLHPAQKKPAYINTIKVKMLDFFYFKTYVL